MKSSIAFCLLFFVALALARPEEHYTDRYDSVNLDEVLSNRRLLEPYIKCTLDQGRCAPDAKELRGQNIYKIYLLMCCQINFYSFNILIKIYFFRCFLTE